MFKIACRAEGVALGYFLQRQFHPVFHILLYAPYPLPAQPLRWPHTVVCFELVPHQRIAHAAQSGKFFRHECAVAVVVHCHAEYRLVQFRQPALGVCHILFIYAESLAIQLVASFLEEIVAYPVCHLVRTCMAFQCMQHIA